MISESLLGIEDLIVRTPGLLARLNDPPISNYDLAKAQRIYWDYFDKLESGEIVRPFIVLQECEIHYSRLAETDAELQGFSAVDVTYSENATSPADHKASKLHFVEFVDEILESMGRLQGTSIFDQPGEAYITVSRMQMIQLAVRSPKQQRDPNRAPTDYWWCKWRCWIGEPEAI